MAMDHTNMYREAKNEAPEEVQNALKLAERAAKMQEKALPEGALEMIDHFLAQVGTVATDESIPRAFRLAQLMSESTYFLAICKQKRPSEIAEGNLEGAVMSEASQLVRMIQEGKIDLGSLGLDQ